MANLTQSLNSWFSQHKQTIVKDYKKLLSFPSISTDDQYKEGIEACAHWLFRYLQEMGFQAEIIPTSRHPLVFAEYNRAGEGAPTLLIYGHYDVQPVDPIQAWDSPPFEPKEIGEKIVARGASDNKGQLFYTLTALKAYLSLKKGLDWNIKYILEGEEESASQGLQAKLPELKEKLACDFVLVPDFDIPSLEKPAITVAIRGMTALDIQIQGSNRDLHSGHYGGIAYNPNRAMVEILAKAYGKGGKILIPGFYEGIEPFSAEEKAKMDLSLSLKEELKQLQIKPYQGGGLAKYSWLLPTFEINGISGGYTGEGFKTVIPARSFAKVSCRLVYKQDPKQVFAAVSRFLNKHLPSPMKLQIQNRGEGYAVKSRLDSLLIQSLQSAYQEVFQKEVRFLGSGGSVPILGEILQVTQADVAFMGVALDTDNIHAPNENFDMERFQKGFLIIGNTLERLHAANF